MVTGDPLSRTQAPVIGLRAAVAAIGAMQGGIGGNPF
jgi:hypothetical protein